MKACSSLGVVPYSADFNAQIQKALDDVQKGCRARLVTKQDIDDAIAYVHNLPFGFVAVYKGPFSYRNRLPGTEIRISWYTWRRQKWVRWSVIRDAIRFTPCSEEKPLYLSQDRRLAYRMTFTNRYTKYKDIRIRRQLQAFCCLLPDEPIEATVDTACGLVLVQTAEYAKYLCSPIGYVKVSSSARTVRQAARSVGIYLTRETASITWDKIEPLWIMAGLAKI
jgi:hypothetical protein